MRLDGQALIGASGPRMASDQGAALEDLDRMSAAARIDTLADQGVVDGVIGPADFDIMILVDAGADLPVSIVVAARRQGSCDGLLFSLEHAVSAAVAFLEPFGIDGGDEPMDGRVQLP